MTTNDYPPVSEVTIRTSALVRIVDGRPYPATDQVHVGQVRSRGHQVWMAYRRHEDEWARRERHGVGGVEDIGTLALLMELPAGLPVGLDGLHPSDRQVLRRLPAGVVRHEATTVIRDLTPIITPLMAIVPARNWDTGAGPASVFAVCCARLVLLPHPPPDPALVLSEASLYGIGVALGDTTGPGRVLLDSTVSTDMRFTPAGWAFSEGIYAQVRNQHWQEDVA